MKSVGFMILLALLFNGNFVLSGSNRTCDYGQFNLTSATTRGNALKLMYDIDSVQKI